MGWTLWILHGLASRILEWETMTLWRVFISRENFSKNGLFFTRLMYYWPSQIWHNTFQTIFQTRHVNYLLIYLCCDYYFFFFFTIGHVLTKDYTYCISITVSFFHPQLESCNFCETVYCHFQLDLILMAEGQYFSNGVLCCVTKKTTRSTQISTW